MQGWLVIYPWRIKLIHARLIFSEERSANSAVGFDMCPTLPLSGSQCDCGDAAENLRRLVYSGGVRHHRSRTRLGVRIEVQEFHRQWNKVVRLAASRLSSLCLATGRSLGI